MSTPGGYYETRTGIKDCYLARRLTRRHPVPGRSDGNAANQAARIVGYLENIKTGTVTENGNRKNAATKASTRKLRDTMKKQ